MSPPGTVLEVEPTYFNRMFLWTLLVASVDIRDVVAQTAGYSLLVGSFASYLWSMQTFMEWEDVRYGTAPQHLLYTNVIEPLAAAAAGLASDFRFFPTFAVIGLLGFFVKRWRNFIFAAWRIEGRFKDLSIAIGSSVKDPDDPATKRFLFTYYRYCVAAMALQYKTLLTDFREGDPFPLCTELNILTPSEVAVLRPCGSRARDTVLTWLACLAQSGQTDGYLRNLPREMVIEKVSDLRANMMFFHGNNFYPMSNRWTGVVMITVELWSWIVILGAPFRRYCQPTTELGWLGALQPWTSVSTFCILFTYWGTLTICRTLAKPFAQDTDTYNIDALIGGTEETVFANLRASFNLQATRHHGRGTQAAGAEVAEASASLVKAGRGGGGVTRSLFATMEATMAAKAAEAEEAAEAEPEQKVYGMLEAGEPSEVGVQVGQAHT